MRNRIRQLRDAKGLERYDVAAALRVSEDTVRRWERTGLVPTQHLPALADLLEATVEHMLGWDLREEAEQEAAA